MIKVNYNQETGKVISFGKDTKPYIEITEQERKQPLPDKYSYYAVVDGKFTIKRRTPTVEELHKDDIQAINREISELKKSYLIPTIKQSNIAKVGLLMKNMPK